MAERIIARASNNHQAYKGESFVANKEKEPWYLLPHTGFNVKLQIDQFEKDFKNGIAQGRSTEEIIETSFQKIEQDIQGFKLEYLSEGLLFPIVLDREIIDGQERIVAPLYNKKLLVETVSEKERRGAVKKSIRQVEQFLVNAPPGSIAVMTSPEGWSGFDGITYLDTQTCIWQIQADGKPIGFTIRTDMTLDENKKLLRALGKEIAESMTQEDQITDIVASPVFIEYSQGQVPWKFADVVNIIKYLKGTNLAYGQRQFEEIFDGLKNPKDLLVIDKKTKQLVENLKESFIAHVSEDRYDRQTLERALGKTILELAFSIRKRKIDYRVDPIYGQPSATVYEIPYQAVLMNVQSLGGCNGGGDNSQVRVFTRSFAPRYAVFTPFAQTESADTGDFPCPRCGHIITFGAGIEECPSCGLKATCG